MATILFVTCNRWPNISQSDTLIADALRTLGHRVEPAPWQGDFARLPAADLIVLRSQWDYHYDIAGFKTWLDQVEAAGLPVYNPAPLVRWNLDKSYLFDLQSRGVKIPHSTILPPDQQPAELYAAQGWSSAVIKPLAGASGHLVERVALDELDEWARRVRAQRADVPWLVQEFLPAIQQTGELSLVFLGGEFSHAVRKQPQPGEYRINSQYQGAITRVAPEPLVIEQAQAVLAALPVVPLYARVDGVVDRDGEFCLIELELNEPGLYFTFAPEQAVHFAEIIHAQWA
jgi:glutathione synthase/RimK-type ligase-like ATP-grasp enzyme